MPHDLGELIRDAYTAARRCGLDERSSFDAAIATLREHVPRLSYIRARRLLAQTLSQGGAALAGPFLA
jgi:hypothetical protein